jgi:uncharacterized protein
MTERVGAVDALRALALLPVLVVNVGGYLTLPSGGPLAQQLPVDSASAFWSTVLVAGLLQGKGIALLHLLFGYSLTLSQQGSARLRKLMGLGLGHGFFIYCGDILSTYAFAGFMALHRPREPVSRLWRRAKFWLAASWLWLALLMLLVAAGGAVDTNGDVALADASSAIDWLGANAQAYASTLAFTAIGFLPLSYGLVLAGRTAGRLRLLQHARWRPLWERAARTAPVFLLLSLVYGLGYAWLQGQGHELYWMALAWVLGPLSMLGLVPWLLLRRWPSWLMLAGRNTLSPYIASSVLIVLLYFGLGLRPSTWAGYGVGLLMWLGLMAWASDAARRGKRLPLEAWMARRRDVKT